MAMKALMLGVFAVFLIALASLTASYHDDSSERPSPGDWIADGDVRVLKDRVVIDVEGAHLAGFMDTNSMDPFLDADAQSIEIVPKHPGDIQAGDVISYDAGFGIVAHRVIDVQKDAFGLYYVVKGDNAPAADPMRVRFSDVRGVLVAVVY